MRMGAALQPAIPATGRIAFDDGGQIWLINADGTDLTSITSGTGGGGGNPSWSPDGSWIAFASNRTGKVNIYVMDADGANQVRVTNNDEHNGSYAWSPDGTQIAFVSDGEIAIINADGTNPRILTADVTPNDPDFRFRCSRPSWSPDGTRLAFESGFASKSETYTIDSDGTNFQFVTQGNTPR
jgi:TolB protein